jgi:hypothetical protein
MRRALANGSRLAVSTWRSDDEIPFFLQLRHVAERQLGAIADQRYSYGDATSLIPCCGRPASAKSSQGRYRAPYASRTAGSSCD